MIPNDRPIGIYEYLGFAVTHEIVRNGFTNTFLAEQLTPYMGVGIAGTYEHIRCVKQGYFCGTCGTPQSPQEKLDRSAILLYALDFSRKYPEIINNLKRIAENSKGNGFKVDGFMFPPENGISYDELMKVWERKMEEGEVVARNLEARV